MLPSDSREQDIMRALKRCSGETIAAALRFRSSHAEADLELIIQGVLERDLPETHVAALAAATDETRLMADLGMDSFGMMEVVMTAEEVLGISVANEELREVGTLGSLKAFLMQKAQAQA